MRLVCYSVAAIGLACLLVPGGADSCLAQGPEPSQGRGPHVPEFVRMFRSIAVQGAAMGPGSGWFGPGQTRFGWEWLATQLDVDPSGTIDESQWKLQPELFARLDRDGDGQLSAQDLDWSMQSPFMARLMSGRARFSQLDADSNGKVTRDEFLALFNKASAGKDFLTPEDVAAVFEPARNARGSDRKPPAPPEAQAQTARPWLPDPLDRARRYLFEAPPGAPTRWVLFKGLFNGEIGSPYEGPAVGQQAPDFLLPTQDGKESFRLSAFREQMPVVLIFGSFT